MAILIYIDSENSKIKKASFEVASYAYALAQKHHTDLIALAINTADVSPLAQYGVKKTIQVNDEKLNDFSPNAYASVVSQVVENQSVTAVVFSSSTKAKTLAPMVAVKLKAGYVPNVISLPESAENFIVKSNVFSNKAISISQITSEVKIVSLVANSFGVKENPCSMETQTLSASLSDSCFLLKTEKIEKQSEKISLDDASVVVSGGRGLKGAENWHLIEDLATELGAATACSKPVSDMGWRPHHEHAGQTGKPIAANLYIAVGISGAIQHLAGVNASKIKVVINNDENAPFFKAADYGVVGDAFQIVPKLIERIKALKK